MNQFRVYIATSIDGFIATPDGGVEWLEPFQTEDFGYSEFAATIGTIVMGRTTYDQALGFGPWAYAGKKTYVLSSRELAPGVPEGVERWAGSVPQLVEALRSPEARDVWVLGGARVIRSFLDADAVDELELFVMPVLLGNGIPLFERREPAARRVRLIDAEKFPSGVTRLVYGFRPAKPVTVIPPLPA